MVRPQNRLLLEITILLILLSYFLNSDYVLTAWSNNAYKLVIKAAQLVVSLVFVGIILRYFYEKFIKDNMSNWLDRSSHALNIENELLLVRKSHSNLDRENIALILQQNEAIFKSPQRIRLDFHKVCVDKVVYAHKLVNNYEFRTAVAESILTKLVKNKIEFDMIICSDTLANHEIAQTISRRTSKPHHFYTITPTGEAALIASKDLRAFRRNPLRVLVLESLLITPKIVYKLKQCLKEVERVNNNNLSIIGVMSIFNGYSNNRKAFSDQPQIKFIYNLFEIDQNQQAASDCTSCYEDKCLAGSVPDIDKNLIFS